MDKLIVEKITPTAKLPTRAHSTDAGLDLYSDEDKVLAPGIRAFVKTGIKMAIPAGCVGLVWDKSGLAQAGLSTIGGVIDAAYRGELIIGIINLGQESYEIKAGQKIAQLLIQKIELPEIVESELDKTDRGDKGFGSTGLN
jgi:dUTP pyrophosphatase